MTAKELRDKSILETFKRHWPWLLLMVTMLFATGIARAAGADMVRLIANELQEGGERLFPLIALTAAVQFVNYSTKCVSAISCTALKKKLEVSLRTRILHALQHIPFLRFEALEPGNVQSILRRDVEDAANSVYVLFSRIGVSVTTLVFTALFMVRIDLPVTVALLAIATLLGVLNRRVLERLKGLALEAKKAAGELSQAVSGTLSAQDSVKVYQAQPFVLGRFQAERRRLSAALLRSERTDVARVAFYTVVNNLILYGSAILLGGYAIAGRGSLGDVAAYISLSTQALVAIEMIFRWMAQVVRCNAGWERVGTLLQLEQEPGQPAVFAAGVSPAKTLEVQGLGFCYEQGSPVFSSRSFTLSRGEMLELTGGSGSGKSTFFKCLLGLYAPQQGEVLLDGQPSTMLQLRAQVGFVPAEPVFYADTLYHNLTLGDPAISPQLCLQNAERLGIRPLVEELGLQRPLRENAAGLSGGQRQMLAILRAVNLDRAVLILDEPFAPLDSKRRSMLAAFLQEYQTEHIVLLTSHTDGEKLAGAMRYPIR